MVSVSTSSPEADPLKKRKRDDTTNKFNALRISTENNQGNNLEPSYPRLSSSDKISHLIAEKKRSLHQKTKRRRSHSSSNVTLTTTSLPNTPYASPEVYPSAFRSPEPPSRPTRCHVCLRAPGPTFQITKCEICDKGMCQVCTRHCIVCDQPRCSKCCIETYSPLQEAVVDYRGEDKEPVCLECVAQLKKQDENEMEQNGL
jgi:hypothetical protein